MSVCVCLFAQGIEGVNLVLCSASRMSWGVGSGQCLVSIPSGILWPLTGEVA